MHYTLVDYENNITSVTFHPLYSYTSKTYFIDTEDSHYITSPKYKWKQGASDSINLHYHDENNTCVMYKRFISNALRNEDTCTLNNNKRDLRKNNIIKYPNGKVEIREQYKANKKDELIPFEIDLTILKPTSQKPFDEISTEEHTVVKKDKKKKSKKKNKKKKELIKKKKSKKKKK